VSSNDRDERVENVDGDVPSVDADDLPEFDDGRYLYCLVRADDDATFEFTGIDDEPVSIVVENGIGAVVHSCDSIYDSADLAQVRRWLVRHQTVIDEASEQFGTPIPFQFDTILRGDDERVQEWIREEEATLERALSGLADHWEYRVEVVETDPVDDETLIERDDRLSELRGKIDDSEEGTAFLLEKKLDQRLKAVRANRRGSATDDLEERLAAEAREVHSLERSPSASLSGEVASTGGDDEGETLCRLTLLAHVDSEGAIGSILDDVASADGLEVRFTGPWPPYTFAPELGGSDEQSNR
jgi:hypothetical protein